MKVLLSAYACEPGLGSEPEVGWQWAMELSKLYPTWVLTRSSNRTRIEAELGKEDRPNLHFAYFDLPHWAAFWKKGNRGVHLYYLLWQIGAYFVARKLHRQVSFNRVHHVTFVTVRQPSFMGLLGIPFILGPVGGGETSPRALRERWPLRARIPEFLRDLANQLVPFDPMMQFTYASANKIYATSAESRDVIPKRYHHKVALQLAIGFGEQEQEEIQPSEKPGSSGPLRVLCAGQLLALKGLDLGFHAIALLKNEVALRLTIVGAGRDEAWLRAEAGRVGITNLVDWVGRVPQEKLFEMYGTHDVLLFPSLRDSGGFVVLEALSRGLPVVNLDLGGPGQVVDETCGVVVTTKGKSRSEVVMGLASALRSLVPEARRKMLGFGAAQRVTAFSWHTKVSRILGQKADVETLLQLNQKNLKNG